MSDVGEGAASVPTGLQDTLAEMARESLGLSADVAGYAQKQLQHRQPALADISADTHTLNHEQAARQHAGMAEDVRRDLEQLRREPAVARIVVIDDDDREVTYFITRASPPTSGRNGVRIASYRSPYGRLAALRIGAHETVRVREEAHGFEVIERALLRPKLADDGWDAFDTRLERKGLDSQTIRSLRALLDQTGDLPDDFFQQWLQDGQTVGNVVRGVSRSLQRSMGLRDQPTLDQLQDDVFRLRLDSRLVLLGPPGSGKTTTLIQRLGLKLDLDPAHTDEDEVNIVERSAAGRAGHAASWIMFTPTELLKVYVKEAFNREGIAAPDRRIRTWSDFRHDLAKGMLGILRTNSSAGSYVLTEDLRPLLTATIERQADWFADFMDWQERVFWEGLHARAKELAKEGDAEVATFASRCLRILEGASARTSRLALLVDLDEEGRGIQAVVTRLGSIPLT